MRTLVKFFLMALTVVAFAACSKDSTKKNVDDYNSISEQLKTLGTPDASWSDSELDHYDQLLTRIEGLQGSLENDDNAYVSTDNRDVFSRMREQLNSARDEKRNKVSREQGQSALLDLANRLDTKTVELAQNMPQETWSKGQLQDYLKKIDEVDNIRNELRSKLGYNSSSSMDDQLAKHAEMTQSLRELTNLLIKDKEDAKNESAKAAGDIAI
jgi:hypothetical protein